MSFQMPARLVTALALTFTALTASAQSFSGALTSTSPLFARPNTSATALTENSTYRFDVLNFRVTSDASFDVVITAATFDTFLCLYTGAFDPNAALSNAPRCNDDFSLTRSGFASVPLLDGTDYFAVITSFAQQATGTYTLSFTSPTSTAFIPERVIDPPVTGVPEPSSFGLVLVGLAGLSAARRRRVRQ
jgi:hypothetical protein